MASPRGNWGLVIGATAALLAGGLLAAVYVLGGRGEEPAAPTVAGIAAAASASDRARASEVLDQVDADILSGEFDTARGKLDAAAREIEANPELKLRAARQRDRIAVATTFAAAQRLEEGGQDRRGARCLPGHPGDRRGPRRRPRCRGPPERGQRAQRGHHAGEHDPGG